ncbi:Trm112 family protein [Hyphomonas sp.]|uniref:Trm112 family protein n=1 Tax=Hyphomonas sp. TaxID=87 RepID=UPI00352912D2
MTDDTPSTGRPHSGVDPRLLEILICPLTRQPLRYNAETDELVSPKARLAYPIRGGIPIMLPEEARDLDLEEGGA